MVLRWSSAPGALETCTAWPECMTYNRSPRLWGRQVASAVASMQWPREVGGSRLGVWMVAAALAGECQMQGSEAAWRTGAVLLRRRCRCQVECGVMCEFGQFESVVLSRGVFIRGLLECKSELGRTR